MMRTCLLFTLASALATSAHAQFVQQGGKLVATDAIGNASAGLSVSVSADGSTAIMGGPNDNNDTGAAWVFTRSEGVWTQQGSKLVGVDAVGPAQQGYSVALSGDGNTAIVGGSDDGGGTGAAWVFVRSGGVWTQQGNKLVGTGAVGFPVWQGGSVALSADGNTAIVGGLGFSSGVSAAWVFARSGAVWTQQGGKLIGGGTSEALSADGNTAIVAGTGGARVYTRLAGEWTQQGNILDGEGHSVALSADGNTAVVGTYEGLVGAASVYTRSGGVWSQEGTDLVGTGAVGEARQGRSVALSADGNTAIVGGPYDGNGGSVWVYTRSGNVWAQQDGKLVGTGAIGDAYAGYSVALSADGNTGIVGGPSDNGGAGAAWVFNAPGTAIQAPTVSTSEATSITKTTAVLGGSVNPNALDAEVWFLYGTDSSMSGALPTPRQHIGSGTLAVPVTANVVGLASGAIYYFQAIAENSAGTAQGYITSFNTLFIQQGSKLVATGAVGGARQGSSVALSADGNTAIVGGPGDNGGTGAAWIYTRSGGVWTQQGGKLVGVDAIGNAGQGYSVALSADGNTALLGGPDDDNFTGATWVFTRSGGMWSQQGSKLVGTGAVGRLGYQGSSVALSADGNTALVGGPYDSYDDETEAQIGAAWVFTRSGGVWSQQGGKLVGNGAVGAASQGSSVALSADGNTAISGGPCDNGTYEFAGKNNPSGRYVCGPGAAWMFTRSGEAWIQQGSKLADSNVYETAYLGFSAALSADGNTALAGGARGEAAWVFTRSGGAWTQQGNELVGTGGGGLSSTEQGSSVALSADGTTALVGGPGDNGGTGATWVFARSGDGWTQLTSKLVGTGAVFGLDVVSQGGSVALSADGTTAMVGGPGDNSDTGSVWVFTLPQSHPLRSRRP
jgi:antibiotic biosynthesis monooxygenase (ABM) superfamily enzyme